MSSNSLDKFTKEWGDDNDFIVAHTSGSTGIPKEIRLSKADMRASARRTNTFFGINEHSVLSLPLSLSYIAGKMMAVRAFEARCALRVIPAANEFEYHGDCDLISVVPSQVPWLLQHDWAANMRNVIVGGAALSIDLQQKLSAAGYCAFASYGMTETCSHVALAPITGRQEPFVAMPGIEFDVDVRNCLVIKASDFSFGCLVTNDVVTLLDSHTFYWRGRADNVINSGGLKLYPEEIEREISKWLKTDFFVMGAYHDKWGECAALVVKGQKQDMLAELLLEHMNHRLMPKKIFFVDDFLLASNGKIKRALPKSGVKSQILLD